MGRVVGGSALLLLALFMLLGFFRSGASAGAPAALGALVVAVLLPAVGGVLLLRGGAGGGRRSARVAQLRQQTLDAEILRLAMRRGGRLTAVEVASELGLTPEGAKEALDGLMTRDVADLALTDGGLIVYTFRDAGQVAQKDGARGLLDG